MKSWFCEESNGIAPMSTGPLPGALTVSSTWIFARNVFASPDVTRAAMPRVANPNPLRTNNMPSEPAKAVRSS